MTDHLSREGRSRVMAAIRSKNTRPELALRKALRQAGVSGYRIHMRTLPGAPDIAFTRWRVAIFVDGAFWHGHPDYFNPSRATPFWRDKISRNRNRDQMVDAELTALGWTVIRCWDFEVNKEGQRVLDRVLLALQASGRPTATVR